MKTMFRIGTPPSRTHVRKRTFTCLWLIQGRCPPTVSANECFHLRTFVLNADLSSMCAVKRLFVIFVIPQAGHWMFLLLNCPWEKKNANKISAPTFFKPRFATYYRTLTFNKKKKLAQQKNARQTNTLRPPRTPDNSNTVAKEHSESAARKNI